jgi:hypothetical protein
MDTENFLLAESLVNEMPLDIPFCLFKARTNVLYGPQQIAQSVESADVLILKRDTVIGMWILSVTFCKQEGEILILDFHRGINNDFWF